MTNGMPCAPAFGESGVPVANAGCCGAEPWGAEPWGAEPCGAEPLPSGGTIGARGAL